MKDLVDYIARALVDHPDQVVVNEARHGADILLKLRVAPEDAGRVIGKGGKVANAIRALLRTAGTRDGQYIELEIE
ncbi:MAG: KH domain-containing protein [Chloroflexi bacterium]|nr:KH domain-containing protein [Chloroflexota bacterium]